MRSTIHLVSPRDYWLFSAGVGPVAAGTVAATHGKQFQGTDLARLAATLRRELAGGVRTRKELDDLLHAHGSTVWGGVWIELIRVPPSGTWERRRADLFQLAEEWLEPERPSEAEGVEHLLRRYLRAFGPGRLGDAANWAGVPPAKMRAAAEQLELRRFVDEDGKPLVDLPRAPLPGDVPAPARFLPTLGRDAARPRPPDADPPRGVPRRDLQQQGAAFVRDRSWSTARSPARGASSAPRARRRSASSPSQPLPPRRRRELKVEGAAPRALPRAGRKLVPTRFARRAL